MANDEYAVQVGEQVQKLIQTHEVLVQSQAQVAARKVRYAIGNYMDTVYERLAAEDGGRLAKPEVEEVDPLQRDIEDGPEPEDG